MVHSTCPQDSWFWRNEAKCTKKNIFLLSSCGTLDQAGVYASFLGQTAHFFSRSDHKHHWVTITVKRMPSPHTADRVSELAKTMLQDWEIPEENVGSVLTDNGSNMVAAFKKQVCATDENMDGRENTAGEQ